MVGGALVATLAVLIARRAGTARAWQLVAVLTGGGILLWYGLLARLLCAAGPVCRTSSAAGVIAAGSAVVVFALALLIRGGLR